MRHTMQDTVCRHTAEAYYEANCEAYSVGYCVWVYSVILYKNTVSHTVCKHTKKSFLTNESQNISRFEIVKLTDK